MLWRNSGSKVNFSEETITKCKTILFFNYLREKTKIFKIVSYAMNTSKDDIVGI